MSVCLTINRTAVTQHVSRTTEEAETKAVRDRAISLIFAEICERLDEIDELHRGRAIKLLSALMAVGRESSIALRMLFRVAHGNTEPLKPFMEQAEKRGLTKQAVHHELHIEIARIRPHYPAIADVLDAMRNSVQMHEDPASNADSLRSCVDG